MRSDQGSEIGKWLDVIEQRGGAYARRRAEAVSLAILRASGNSPARPQMVDPSLIAAQGQDWLRRGNPGRGGGIGARNLRRSAPRTLDLEALNGDGVGHRTCRHRTDSAWNGSSRKRSRIARHDIIGPVGSTSW